MSFNIGKEERGFSGYAVRRLRGSNETTARIATGSEEISALLGSWGIQEGRPSRL